MFSRLSLNSWNPIQIGFVKQKTLLRIAPEKKKLYMPLTTLRRQKQISVSSRPARATETHPA